MQPFRTRYKIAFTISRRGYAAGRPPDLGEGTHRSIRRHCSSVRSVGYELRFMPPSVPHHLTLPQDHFLDTL